MSHKTRIKILKCNDPSKWYYGREGEVYPLLAIEAVEYKTRAPSGYLNFISKQDSKLVR
jgi:hypothetical protein